MPNSILGLSFPNRKQVPSLAVAPTILQSISETVAWSSRRQLSSNSFRSAELDPSAILDIPGFSHDQDISAWLHRKRESYSHAIPWINQTRSALLKEQGIALPDSVEAQSKGKLLLYEPLETVDDGAAQVSSQGFYDWNDAPPWDTWFLYAGGSIFCCIPESAITSAQAGIDANPVDCIHWVDWSKLARHTQSQ